LLVVKSTAAYKAIAYAIAPLKPENHITNCVLTLNLVCSVLYLFTISVQMKIFKNLATLRLTIVENKVPHPIV